MNQQPQSPSPSQHAAPRHHQPNKSNDDDAGTSDRIEDYNHYGNGYSQYKTFSDKGGVVDDTTERVLDDDSTHVNGFIHPTNISPHLSSTQFNNNSNIIQNNTNNNMNSQNQQQSQNYYPQQQHQHTTHHHVSQSNGGSMLSDISAYVKHIYLQASSTDSSSVQYNSSSSYNNSVISNQTSIQQSKDTVIWTHFAHVEVYTQKDFVNSSTLSLTNDNSGSFHIQKKLYLILTYTNGFQVFDVNEPKRITEIASVKGSPVRYATVLSPAFPPRIYFRGEVANNESNTIAPIGEEDNAFVNSVEHPLLAVIPADDPTTLKFYSLKSHSYVHSIKFKYEIYEVKSTPSIVVVMDERNVYWLNPATLNKVGSFPCYQSKKIDEHESHDNKSRIQDYSGVIAIGTRWIAFPSDGSVTNSSLDLTTSSNQTYAEISLDVAKKAASGIYYLGDLGVKKVTNYINPEKYPDTTPSRKGPVYGSNAGTVEIRDLKTKKLMVQFRAHTEPIASMSFDPSGTLLITTSITGTHLNIYQIMPSSTGKISSKNIRHIYRLFRGLTTARLKDVQFSINSKWVAVSSTRETTHLFAINPTGGPVDPMTHLPVSYQNSLFLKDRTRRRKNRSEEKNPISVSVVDRIHHSSSFFSKTDSNPTSDIYASKTSAAFFSPGDSENENIFVCTNTGILNYYSLQPCLKESSSGNEPKSILNGIISDVSREGSPSDSDDVLQIKINNCGRWNLCRSRHHDIVTVPIEWSNIALGSSNHIVDEDDMDVKSQWISNVEIETYQAPEIPLWMSGYFKFKTFESQPVLKENESDLYPEVSSEGGDDSYAYSDQLSKSVFIKVSEPIPISNVNSQPPLRKVIANEPSAPLFQEDIILKAIQTPIASQRVTNKVPSPNNWEMVQSDDGLMMNSTTVESMRKSCLRNGLDTGSNKMKKSVRMSIDTNQQDEPQPTDKGSFDQYFLNSGPTIQGISSSDVFSKREANISSKMSQQQISNLKVQTPPELITTPTRDQGLGVTTAETQKGRKLPSPIKTMNDSIVVTQHKTTTPSPVSQPQEEDNSATVKMTGSFSFVHEDYFGSTSSSRKSLIESQTQDEYISEGRQSSVSTPESSASSLSDAESFEKQQEEEDNDSEEEDDGEPFSLSATENIRHYEPVNNSGDEEDADLEDMENDLMIEMERANNARDEDDQSDSDDEVEVKRSHASFEINNDFFSKDRPPVQQADSFHQADVPEISEVDMLNMQFSSELDVSNFSNFKSAYESQMSVKESGSNTNRQTTQLLNSKEVAFEYDFESEEEQDLDDA